jgi:hypothetical protein
MITDELIIWLLFQLILFVINLVGFRKIPILLFFGLIGSILIAIPTLMAFDEYIMMGFLLVMINTAFPVIALTRSLKR